MNGNQVKKWPLANSRVVTTAGEALQNKCQGLEISVSRRSCWRCARAALSSCLADLRL